MKKIAIICRILAINILIAVAIVLIYNSGHDDGYKNGQIDSLNRQNKLIEKTIEPTTQPEKNIKE
jgi:hypothetical protein